MPRSVTITWDSITDVPTMTYTPADKPPVITPPPSTTGIRASRVADFIRPSLGWNGFSSMSADANVWGAWPADYSPPSELAADAFFFNNTGHDNINREYSYASRRSIQEPWGKLLRANTGVRFSVAIGANGGVSDAIAVASMAIASSNSDGWIEMIEGINEPNNKDFNGNAVDPAVTVACQKILWAAGLATKANKFPVKVAGPSIVAGMPYPEGWIVGTKDSYFSAPQMADIRANMELINGHFYPPYQADQPSGSPRGSWLRDYIAGLRVAYGNSPIVFTEGHPSLYANAAEAYRKFDPKYDAYYGLTNMLSMFKQGIVAHYWFALIDHGEKDPPATGPIYPTGFFPRTGGVNPKPVANSFRALAQLMPDLGGAHNTFAPDLLDYTVGGLSASDTGIQTLLLQSSDKTFYPLVWKSQALPGGPTTPVSVRFARQVASVKAYRISDPATPIVMVFNGSNALSVDLPIGGDVFLLQVKQ